MMLDMLVARYGLVIIFLGAGIEGEATVVTGGLLAHEGLLDTWASAATAAAGSFAADQTLFVLGRHLGHNRRVADLLKKPAAARVKLAVEAHPTAFTFGFRFLIGMRTISPLVIGTTSVAASRFLLVNLIAALIWGAAFTTIGYLFGRSIEHLLGHIPRPAKAGLSAVPLAVIVMGLKIRRGDFGGRGSTNEGPQPRGGA